jgi:hypothetical protein
MATQSDLDKMRKKLSDLDAKLKSMRGNQKTPVTRPPNFVDMGRSVPRRPIDIVRDSGFGSAMANQSYANLMRDLQARIAAERGGQAFPPAFGRPSPEPMINPETIKKARDEYVNQNPGDVNRKVRADLIKSRYLGETGREMSGFDKWFETNYINNPNSSLSAQERMTLNPRMGAEINQPRPSGPDFIDARDPNRGYTMNMINYYDPATGEVTSRTNGVVPAPGSRFVRYSGRLPQGPNGEELGYIPGYVPPQQGGQRQPLPPDNATFTPALQFPQEVRDAIEGRLNAARAGMGERILTPIPQGPQVGVGSFGDTARRLQQSGQLPYQQPFNPNAPSLMPIRTPGSDAQNQQMQNYQNLLRQGIQRSNTMNQDAASNFANMQAGAPTTQPATPAKANPVVPIAGMGIQPKATPAPRKFSTVNTPSARFF